MIKKRNIIVLIIGVSFLMLPMTVNNLIKSDDNGVVLSVSDQRTPQQKTLNITEILDTLIPIICAICALIAGYYLGIYVGEARKKI